MTTKSLNHTNDMIPLESALNGAIACSELLEMFMETAQFDTLGVTCQQIIVLTARFNDSVITDLMTLTAQRKGE
jgi:hypothetical protein